MANGDDVKFKSPTTGKVQAVPPEHWDDALSQGYTPTTHTVLRSPDGQRGMIKNEEIGDYLKQGFAPDPIGQARQDIRNIPKRPAGALDEQGRIPNRPIAAEETMMAEGAPAGMTGMGILGTAALLKTNPAAALRMLAGSFGGAYAGGHAGKYLGGEKGEILGKMGGSLLGGYAGATGLPIKGGGGMLETLLSRGETPPVDPVAEAVKARQASWIPMRMPKTAAVEAPLGSPENPGFSSKLPTRLPPSLRGDPFNPESTAPRLGTNRTTGVSVYPEPREPMPGDRPGAAWSQGRESTLPASAQRGAPGAVDVLRNIGKPIVLTPREGVGYPPAGEFEAIRESLGNPQAPEPPQGVYEPGERESYLDSVIRGSSGENRDYTSLLRKLQKTRPKPLF